MSAFLALLVVTLAPAAEVAARPVEKSPFPVEIVIAGTGDDRDRIEEALRQLLARVPEVRWSTKDRLPDGEAPRVAQPDARVAIWIDMTNPVEVVMYVPSLRAGDTMVRVVERSDEREADATIHETIAQIVKTAVQAVRAQDRTAGAEGERRDVSPPDGTPATTELVAAPLPVGSSAGASEEPGTSPAERFSVLLSAGAHTSPLDLSGPAYEEGWLGPSVIGHVRWHIHSIAVSARVGWETSYRARGEDRYRLDNTYLTGTLGAAYVVRRGRLSAGLGLEAGVLVLRQTASLNAERELGYADVDRASTLPGQMGRTTSAGLVVGPTIELALSLPLRLFVQLDVSLPFTGLRTQYADGTGWERSHYLRTTLGIGFRL